ncbi:phosphoribosylformylglycinamidine synthase I [Elusimicrobiota bacterium]
MAKPKVLILTGNGLNCEEETSFAFEIAGAASDKVHLSDLLSGEKKLSDYKILAFIGGFSFGDHLGAGTVQAVKFKHGLRDDMDKFIQKEGLVIGICNGFQTLVKLGLLPGFDNDYKTQRATLTVNDSCRFEDRWVHMKVNPDSKCVFTKGIEQLFLPVRHGEGKFFAQDDELIQKLFSQKQVVAQYTDDAGDPTDKYPANPNGSLEAIAGICDPTGKIFGIMPHPEGYLAPHNHPSWTRLKAQGKFPKQGEGVQIFKNAIKYFN